MEEDDDDDDDDDDDEKCFYSNNCFLFKTKSNLAYSKHHAVVSS